jgi:hypothetical protein
MENKGLNNSQNIQIQGLLDSFLRLKSSNNNSELSRNSHLDEDSLTAFVEGNLNRRESEPIVRHLVDCSFCRHVTTELVKLDYAFDGAEEVRPQTVKANEPAKISEVLSGLLSRIFGTSDGAVFAHHESEKDSEKEENSKEEK